jgi:adenosine deaminase CECR1
MKFYLKLNLCILIFTQILPGRAQNSVKTAKMPGKNKTEVQKPLSNRMNEAEKQASGKLDRMRSALLTNYRKNNFIPASRSFYQSQQAISQTALYQLLTKMPKGGALHLHTEGTASAEWVIATAIQTPHCYIFWEEDKGSYLKGQIAFFKDNAAPSGFRKAADLASTEKQFTSKMLELLTFSEQQDADSVQVWKEFEKRFTRVRDFAGYKPLFKAYYVQGFQELIRDNIQYAEIRAILGFPIYDLEHSRADAYYTTDSIIQYFREVQETIKATDPAFRFRLIYTFIRAFDQASVDAEFVKAFRYQKRYPDIISGFDLVGEEDRGHTTAYFSDVWRKKDSLEKAYGLKMPFVFHDGESNDPGNDNLYTAVALNSRRIGHGFNLFLYPDLYEPIRRQDIALEICPLSSQILHFIHDLRTHPAIGYLRAGIPCVISSDDPAVFGYGGLSYDFWSAYMAWNLDLGDLKKLCFNSIRYSLLPENEKQESLHELQKRWDLFVAQLNK